MIAAFHHVSAVLLDDPEIDHFEGDVLVLGEDRDAVAAGLRPGHRAFPGARGVYAGRLRNAGQVEALTANLIAINRRYKTHCRHRITDSVSPRTSARRRDARRGTRCTSSAARAAPARPPSPARWPAPWPPPAAGCCSARSRAGTASPTCSGARPGRRRGAPDDAARRPAAACYGLAIDAEDALLEYLETFYHLGFAGKALDRFGAVDFATSIAPGLRDVLLTGKVYEAVRRAGEKGAADAYDAVVLDAPPTGRIAQFLNVHEAVSGLAKVGPIRNQADSIMRCSAPRPPWCTWSRCWRTCR